MLFQWIGPDFARPGDVSGFGGIDALEPCFILAPKDVAAACDVEFAVEKDGHPENVARPFAAVRRVTMDFGFGSARIKVELENLF